MSRPLTASNFLPCSFLRYLSLPGTEDNQTLSGAGFGLSSCCGCSIFYPDPHERQAVGFLLLPVLTVVALASFWDFPFAFRTWLLNVKKPNFAPFYLSACPSLSWIMVSFGYKVRELCPFTSTLSGHQGSNFSMLCLNAQEGWRGERRENSWSVEQKGHTHLSIKFAVLRWVQFTAP